MLVKLQRMFATGDNRYDPNKSKSDVFDIPVPLAQLPSDALIMDGEFKGLTAAQARAKKSAPVKV